MKRHQPAALPACLAGERLPASRPPAYLPGALRPTAAHMQAPKAGAQPPQAKPASAGQREEGEAHVVAPADTRCHEDTGTPGTKATPGSNPETVEGREAWRD